MAEIIILTNPVITPQIVVTEYTLVYLAIDWNKSHIVIYLEDNNQVRKTFSYGGLGPNIPQEERDEARNMMIGLNKANLSIKSLHRRVIEKLIADGKLEGTITGIPE